MIVQGEVNTPAKAWCEGSEWLSKGPYKGL